MWHCKKQIKKKAASNKIFFVFLQCLEKHHIGHEGDSYNVGNGLISIIVIIIVNIFYQRY